MPNPVRIVRFVRVLNKLDRMPKQGYKRLYRGESNAPTDQGKWYTTELNVAEFFAREHALKTGKPSPVVQIDLPIEEAAKYDGGSASYYLPPEVAARAVARTNEPMAELVLRYKGVEYEFPPGTTVEQDKNIIWNRVLKPKSRGLEESITMEGERITRRGFRNEPEKPQVPDPVPAEYPLASESKGNKKEAAFNALANAQRGKPESAMMKATMMLLEDQKYRNQQGIGVYTTLLEHVGDLTHRMAERGGGYGAEFVKPKVNRALSILDNSVDRKYISSLDVPRPELDAYIKAHSALPVYNRAQQLGIDAAIAIGNKDVFEARRKLQELKEMIDSGEYAKISKQFDPDFEKPK